VGRRICALEGDAMMCDLGEPVRMWERLGVPPNTVIESVETLLRFSLFGSLTLDSLALLRRDLRAVLGAG